MSAESNPRNLAGAPSARRRWLAVISLAATALVIAAVAVFLVRHPELLIGGLIGLAVAVVGIWWVITEQNPRRAVGIAATVLGLALIAFAVIRAATDTEQGLLRLAIVLILFAVAAGTARAALVRDLHELDRLRGGGRFRPRKPVLICNPWSGGGKVEKFDLAGRAEELGVEVIFLAKGLDLEQLARDAIHNGADCIGMAGGDGSQALVASIAIEKDIPFVCISAGTRNHFAQDLGFDKEDPRKGMIAFTEGVDRRIDYATVGDRLFVNNVSLGIYATIVQEDSYRDAKVETSKEKLPQMLGRQAEPFDLQFTTPDGDEVDGAFLILVSNNPYVMGPSLDISQRRSLDTGQLGVFAVNASTGAEAAKLVARSTVGLGKRDPNVFQFSAPDFEVRSRSGRAFAGIDGESLDLDTPLDFRIHPGGLRLLVPRETLDEAEKRRVRGFKVGYLLSIASGRQPESVADLEP